MLCHLLLFLFLFLFIFSRCRASPLLPYSSTVDAIIAAITTTSFVTYLPI